MEVCVIRTEYRLKAPTDKEFLDTLITCIPNRWQERSKRIPPWLTAAIGEDDLVRGPSIEHPAPPSPINDPFMTAAHGEHGGPNLDFDGVESIPDIIDVAFSVEDYLPSDPHYPRLHPPTTARRRPTARSHSADDPMNVQHKVLRHLKETSRKPIESIYDLAGLIATCCASTFDETQIPEDMQFFDFFERSIGSVVCELMSLNLLTFAN